MKKMIQRIRDEKGGFTLAELLIVVAIIAVLVAIAIPVFTSQLNNAKAATDEANARSIYAVMSADYLAAGHDASVTASGKTYTVTDAGGSVNTFTFSDIMTSLTSGKTASGSPTVTVSTNGSTFTFGG